MNFREYWAQNPRREAIQIVQAGFGQYYVEEMHALYTKASHNIRLVHVSECDAARYELPIREQLNRIGWQMVTISLLDNSRFKNLQKAPVSSPSALKYNRYGVAPIGHLVPRPTIVYHATETWRAERICAEGFRPSCGSLFADCEGKIHFCAKLPGQTESAACWAKLLSAEKGVFLGDYSILEVDLTTAPSARVHQDLQSESGIVVDQFDRIPNTAVTQEFINSGGAWIAKKKTEADLLCCNSTVW